MATMTKETIATVKTGVHGYNALVERIEKFNRRASRHGMDSVGYTVLSEKWVSNGRDKPERLEFCIEINGCEPRIDGWKLIARIDFANEIGIVVHAAPGVEADLSEYRDHDAFCDHCRSRRKRNDCYVLEDGNGYRKVVGRQCLADFVRNGDATAFVAFAEFSEWLANIDHVAGDGDEGWDRGGRVETSVPVEAFASISALFIRKFGWTSRGAAKDLDGISATADDVVNHICNSHPEYQRWAEKNELFVSDGDTDLARKALEWVQSLTPEQLNKSEYLYTLSLIVSFGRVTMKNAGYAASIVSSYQRECDRQAERAEKAANAPEKEFIGSKGERLRDLVVTVKRVRYFEGTYGTTTIVAMEHKLPNGSVAPLCWFASKSLEFEEGNDYLLTGTIKDHKSDDRYGPQTMVNRCKLTEL